MGLGVQFREAHPAFERLCGLGEFGCHHPAGAAPRGPEIHHEGQIVDPRGLLKNLVRHFFGLILNQQSAASPAFGALIKSVFRYPVSLTTFQTCKSHDLKIPRISCVDRIYRAWNEFFLRWINLFSRSFAPAPRRGSRFAKATRREDRATLRKQAGKARMG